MPVKPRPKSISESDARVLAVYDAYPRKSKPTAARRAIANAIKALAADNGRGWMISDDPVTDAYRWLLARVEEYADSWYVANKPGYIPHPATWMNAGQYDDEPGAWDAPAPAAAGAPGSAPGRNLADELREQGDPA